jgi:hypothetical protein
MIEAGVPSRPHRTRPWIDRAARSCVLVGVTLPRVEVAQAGRLSVEVDDCEAARRERQRND